MLWKDVVEETRFQTFRQGAGCDRAKEEEDGYREFLAFSVPLLLRKMKNTFKLKS